MRIQPHSSKGHRLVRQVLRCSEPTLLLLALGAFAYAGFIYGRALYKQTRSDPSMPALALKEGSLVGRIEIPPIGLSAIVFEGTTEDVLSYGVGHLSGSALPGTSGNAVLAAHRDTFFRPLRHIHKGDLIVLSSPLGKFSYVVEYTATVQPQQSEVLRATPGTTLTLITCYPFSYVGSAPKRFIVRARKA